MLGRALGALLQGNGGEDGKGLAAALEQNGKWRKWTGNTRLLAQTAKKAKAVLTSACWTPKLRLPAGRASGARITYAAWSEEQEQRWTLASAIAHYRERREAWPDELADLVRPYPDNMLSGSSTAMESCSCRCFGR